MGELPREGKQGRASPPGETLEATPDALEEQYSLLTAVLCKPKTLKGTPACHRELSNPTATWHPTSWAGRCCHAQG